MPIGEPFILHVAGVCVFASVLASLRQSWLGCWGVCVCVHAPLVPRQFSLGCAVPMFVLRSGFSGAPRHSWLGCSGVCVCVWALPVPSQSWMRFVVCRLGSGFDSHPAHPGFGVGACLFVCALRLHPAGPGTGLSYGCVCLSSCFGCAPPFLAGVCHVGVCAWVPVSAAPRPSWLGCRVVCVFVCARPLYPAIRGPNRGVCVSVRVLAFTPPILGGVRVCLFVRAPLIPRHSWLGCVAWVCVCGFRFQLRPASLGWGVGVCSFVCTLRLHPARPGWGSWCVCVDLGLDFHLAEMLARVFLLCTFRL